MRARALVSLLAVAGLLLATPLGWSAGSSVGPPSPGEVPAPAPAPAATPQDNGTQEEGGAPGEPAAVAHRQTVLQRFLCENCHRLDGGWLLPDSHASLAGQACEGCHAPAPELPPVTVHYTPGDDTATQGLCTLCHGDVVRQAPPQIPSQASGAEGCASCHASEQRVIPPADHPSGSVATCMVCHETRVLAAAAVPHRVEGWEECSFCHGEGRLTPLQGGHTDLTDDACLRCHDAVETPPSMTRTMLEHSDVKGGCTSCHSEGLLAPLPESHEGRTEVTCSLCHNATSKQPPLVPHSVTGGRVCSACHTSETLRVKLDGHAHLSDGACVACHREQPGGVPSIPHTLTDRADCTDCHAPTLYPRQGRGGVTEW